jgi:hypothetical protein
VCARYGGRLADDYQQAEGSSGEPAVSGAVAKAENSEK